MKQLLKLLFKQPYSGVEEKNILKLFFDIEYYLKIYPDVFEADIDPLEHFCSFGCHEGRNPNLFFDTNFYLSNNQDVAKSKINPLLHFIKWGFHEG